MQLELKALESVKVFSNHDAFTDLFFFQNTWWLAFRSASSHMSFDGRITLLTSKDFKTWQNFQQIKWTGDLRDPKFYQTPEGDLGLMAGIRMPTFPSKQSRVYSLNWLIQDNQISEAFIDKASEGTWRWSATKILDKLYSVGYTAKDLRGCLYESVDGKYWQKKIRPFFKKSRCYQNEASLLFDKTANTAYCLLRRDGFKSAALLGEAKPPFARWKWRTLNQRIGGPKLVQLANGELIAAYRIFKKDEEEIKAYTIISRINLQNNQFEELYRLPSAGDCSYPGLVVKDEMLYLSYYSSHEEQTQVYVAVLSIVDTKALTPMSENTKV